MIYRFGRFELDERAGELRQDGKPVSIQPKPLALLFFLVEERHRVLSQDEILETLWPGTAVTSGSLTRAVSHARRAIGDTHKGELLRSLPRRGYRFVADVIEIGREAEAPSGVAPGEVRTAPRKTPVEAADVFVGRDDAIAALANAWQRAQRGPGRLVLITGPAGVGKTRLSEVFARQASERGALVVFGRGRDGEGVPAFWIWSQVLRELAATGRVEEGDFEGILSGLRNATDAEQRFRFFDSVAQSLVEASCDQPLILILEDLQWATSPSLRLLEHLAFELANSRLLVVATIRNESHERGSVVDQSLSSLRRHDHVDRIELGGLSRAEIGSLLAQVIGRPAPTELTSELFARTEGVPLFVREAVRLLDERGDLRRPERISRRGISLPAHAVDLIRRKLDGLSRACADLVSAGAVLGREFMIGHVAAVARVERDVALDLIEEAVAAGALEEVADAAATYRFTHALFQEAAYETLQAGARARFHARAAARLERQYAENPAPVIAELAHHHHQSIAVGDPERAFECAILAAEEAGRVLAYEQAAIHYEQALDALEHFDTMDATKRLHVLIELGEAHRLAGDRSRRREVSAEAMESARALGRHDEFAQAAIRFCDVNEWAPDEDGALQAIYEALDRVAEDETLVRARLTTRRAFLRIRNPAALEIAREAVELARASGDPLAIQEAVYVLLYSLAGPDHLEERRVLGEEVTEAAIQLKSPDSAVIALLDIASDHLALGDRDAAAAKREEVERLIGEQPSLASAWHTKVFDSGFALMEGRIEGVEQTMADGLLLGRRIAHPYAQVCYDGHLMQLHRYRGEFDAIDALYAPKLKPSASHGPSHWPQAIYARNLIRLDARDRAFEIWQDLARFDFVNVSRSIRWIATMIELAHLCADLEDSNHAESLIGLLAPVEHLHSILPMVIGYGGPASFALARLHELMGDADTAIDEYEAALEAAIGLGARPMQAHIQRAMLGPISRRGDRERARELETTAGSLEERLGCRL